MRSITFNPTYLLIGLGLLLSACGEEPSRASYNRTVSVGVFTITPQPLEITTDLPGRTVAYRLAEVRPQVNGIVKERLLTEGANVKIGQQLYQIDDQKYRATFERAQANLHNAELLRKRYKELLQSNSVSKQQFDDADAAWQLAKAEAEIAKIDLAYTKVVAPVTGRIGRSSVSEGALVTSGQAQALATIQQIDPIYVDIRQPVSELLRLQKALQDGRIKRSADGEAKIVLLLEDGTSYEHEGVLRFSEVGVDQETGSVTLRAVVPNPDWRLLPGMFVHGRLSLGYNDSVILVPQQAVQRDATGKPAVWVINEENKAERRSIKTGRTIGNMWMVNAGLKAGDEVVTEGLLNMRPGVEVSASPASNVHPILDFTAANP
ncbi:efflux RND transporter periplasmic adaptor subunit [Aestuariicella hydrocarbonica]|uniref:Efflux RND transporter periplasmic adaptor subunit n=1 Tax=Pseudomaricurvus hydrocarbonicus TaxID=1470433 RepID=A0A9E5JS43_9GAMM|nr:efflux RND transporter periplasmic adaptor subunit [Aestuariicella hydrocarbonica]